MTTQDTIQDLQNKKQFSNHAAGWYTLNSPEKNMRFIVFDGDNFKSYKTLTSYAIRINQLINRGY